MPVGNIPTGFYMCIINPVLVNVTLNNKSSVYALNSGLLFSLIIKKIHIIANNANKEIINSNHPGKLYETKRAFQHQTKPDHTHKKKLIA